MDFSFRACFFLVRSRSAPTVAFTASLLTSRLVVFSKDNNSSPHFAGGDPFPSLLHNAHMAVAQISVDGRFIRVNPRWCEILGYTESEALQLGVADITHPDSAQATHDNIETLRLGGSHFVIDKKYIRKDRSTFWASTTVSALRDAAGQLTGLVALMIDAGPQQRSQRLVGSQNEALELIITGAPLEKIFNRLLAVVEAESDGDALGSILLLDPTTRQLRHGAAPSLPASYNRAIDGVMIDADVGTCAAAAARNERVITPDLASAPGWREFKDLALPLGLRAAWSLPIVSSKGKVLGTFGTYFRQCREPSSWEIEMVSMLAKTASLAIERHQSEATLGGAISETERQKRLYETVLSNTPDLVYVFDLQHQFTYANDALLAMWGKTFEESVGKTCLELGYEPWHAAMHDREIDQVVATKRFIRGEVAFNGTNGRRYYDYIMVPVIGSTNEVEAVAGTTRDITDQRRNAATVKFLGDLAQSLSVMTEEKEIIRHACSALGRQLGAHRCHFAEFNAKDRVIHAHENWVRDDAPDLGGMFRLDEYAGAELWEKSIAGDHSVENVEMEALIGKKTAANYLALGVRSYAVQPIKRAGVLTTLLFVTEDHPRKWTEEELRLIENVAVRVWPLVERSRAQNALRAARDEALAASHAKDHFLAALSHELRTPLNPVLLIASEAASDRSLPEPVREDFETIVRNITLEARLIDDLLDLTRIAHDKLTLEFGWQDAHALLRRVLAAMQVEVKGKNISLKESFAELPAMVKGDEVRLQQVFFNLLKNALKFTAEGGTVTVTTRIPETFPKSLLIEVTDTGIGLTPGELSRIFSPFAQGEHSENGRGNRFGGLGLGLAISRKIIDLHGGDISARSQGRDRGATFVVRLPLAESEKITDVVSANERAPDRKAALNSGRRVLLIEDHESSRVALARLLTNRKLQVVQASSVAEALEKAQHVEFDFVISDIGLPDGNGYDLIKTLQAGRPGRAIALSGYGTEEDIARSKQAGFTIHLTKPVQIHALEQALEQIARS